MEVNSLLRTLLEHLITTDNEDKIINLSLSESHFYVFSTPSYNYTLLALRMKVI
jgi:hypothetical protein